MVACTHPGSSTAAAPSVWAWAPPWAGPTHLRAGCLRRPGLQDWSSWLSHPTTAHIPHPPAYSHAPHAETDSGSGASVRLTCGERGVRHRPWRRPRPAQLPHRAAQRSENSCSAAAGPVLAYQTWPPLGPRARPLAAAARAAPPPGICIGHVGDSRSARPPARTLSPPPPPLRRRPAPCRRAAAAAGGGGLRLCAAGRPGRRPGTLPRLLPAV